MQKQKRKKRPPFKLRCNRPFPSALQTLRPAYALAIMAGSRTEVLQHKVEEEEARQSPGFMKELHEKCSRNLATSVPRAASHLQVGTESGIFLCMISANLQYLRAV